MNGCGENVEIEKPKLEKPKTEIIVEDVEQDEKINDNLTRITDPKKVEELRQKLLEEEAFKKELELEDLKSRTFAERYKLGDTSIVVDLIETLKNGEYEDRKEAFKTLQSRYEAPKEYRIREKELQDAILSQITDDKFAYHAIQLAGIMRINGFASLFEKEILKGESKNIGRLFYWLGTSGRGVEVLDFIEQKIKSSKLDKSIQKDVISGLKQFGRNGSKKIKEKVGQICLSIYNKKIVPVKSFDDLKNSRIGYSSADNILYCLYNYGDKKVVPIATSFLKKGVREEQSLIALIKLNGNSELSRLKEYLGDSVKFDYALSPAKVFHEAFTKQSEIPKLILENLDKFKNNSIRRVDKVVETLIKMDQTIWLTKLESIITSESLIDNLLNSYAILRNNPEEIAEALYLIGLIDTPIQSSIISEAKFHDRYFGKNAHIFNLLHFSGLFIDLDTSLLIEQIASTVDYLFENSSSVFENSLIGTQLEDENEISITLIFNENAYLYNSNKGSNCYLEMIKLLNQVLEDNNAEERFCFLSASDGGIRYLFGDQEYVKVFKTQCGLVKASQENEQENEGEEEIEEIKDEEDLELQSQEEDVSLGS
ncbi:MAG: hypothetical protein CMD18_02070 [Flavobacteriales bacterium]|nr:hypothetical protein [Flavobacteriales bacterium]